MQSFPFDKLKIDRSFIQNLLTRDGASAIVRAITELAHALNIETTAEGVEETAQLMELRAHGCSSVQGFLFAEPMTLGDVEQLFRDDRRVDAGRRLMRSVERAPSISLDRRCSRSAPSRPASRRRSAAARAQRRFARRGERIGPGAAQQHEIGAEREHPDHVEPRTDAAVGQDRHASADRFGDRGRARAVDTDAVELAAAMVGHDDAVGAAVRGLARVVGVEAGP